jgi:hypothetical protein
MLWREYLEHHLTDFKFIVMGLKIRMLRSRNGVISTATFILVRTCTPETMSWCRRRWLKQSYDKITHTREIILLSKKLELSATAVLNEQGRLDLTKVERR